MSKTRTLAKRSMRALEYREKYGWKQETPIGAARPSTLRHIERFGTKSVLAIISDLKPVEKSVIKQMPMSRVPVEAGADAPTADTPSSTVSNGRGTCPQCGRREKVRKDGTMTKHLPVAGKNAGEAEACSGVGKAAL